jgi:TRAP-type C4-dicarboxylate transport system permease small subunit
MRGPVLRLLVAMAAFTVMAAYLDWEASWGAPTGGMSPPYPLLPAWLQLGVPIVAVTVAVASVIQLWRARREGRG